MPVIIEVEDKLLQERMGDENIEVLTERSLDERIREGLRATLESESLVTGVLYIGLNFHPNAPPWTWSCNALVAKLDASIGELHMAQINQGLTNLLVSMDRLVSSPEITNDLVAVRTTLDQYRLLGEKLNSRIDPLADAITNTLAEADRALAQFRGAAQNVRTLLAPDAPLPNDLDQALRQLSGAVQSLSALLEFLKQHPNALITGREKFEKKP